MEDNAVNLMIDQDKLSNLKIKEEKTEENAHRLRELGNSNKHPTYI